MTAHDVALRKMPHAATVNYADALEFTIVRIRIHQHAQKPVDLVVFVSLTCVLS